MSSLFLSLCLRDTDDAEQLSPVSFDTSLTDKYKEIERLSNPEGDVDSFGWTDVAEKWNGRIAMVAAILVLIRESSSNENMPMMVVDMLHQFPTISTTATHLGTPGDMSEVLRQILLLHVFITRHAL